MANQVDIIQTDTTTDIPGTITTMQGNVTDILADTNELQTDWHDGGRLDLLLDGAASAGDPWTTALPGAYGAGTAGKIIGDNINAPLSTIDTVVDAILEDTAEIGAAGEGLTNINLPDQTMNITGSIDGNLSGSVGSVTGHTAQTGDSFAIVNGDHGLVSIQDDVDAILIDTGTTLDGNITAIKAVTDALTPATAAKMAISGGTMVAGAAATGTLSTTEMTTDLTISVNDQYNGRILIFASNTTTAALQGQATDITDTVTTDGKLTFTALTTAPVNGDTFIIV